MTLIENLTQWGTANNLKIEFTDNDFLFTIGGKKFYLMTPNEEGLLINEQCNFTMEEEEMEAVDEAAPDYLAFKFGGRWYYCIVNVMVDKDTDTYFYAADFNDLKYFGEADLQITDVPFAHLGIHTEYELLNGSHKADYWCKKAKFYKHNILALCDRNTLAGTLSFQIACRKENIKPILGMTAIVAINYVEDQIPETYEVKLYVKNEQGWQSLLQINKQINVDHAGLYITEEELFKHGKGLVCVLPPLSRLKLINNIPEAKVWISNLRMVFEDLYYQIDTVQYYDVDTDNEYLTKTREYIHHLREYVTPVLIGDSYYLDKEMFHIKEMLNKVNKHASEYTEDAHYKTLEEHYLAYAPMFKNEQDWIDLFYECVGNTVELADKCNFEIEIGKSKLPRYKFVKGKTNEDFFFELLEAGLQKKIAPFYKGKKFDEYVARVEKEVMVIVPAGFVDYFLILWDIVGWAKSSSIYVGTGRGSVAGCLLAFLLDITTVDPIKHDLLFERFMNETRAMPEEHYTMTFIDGTELKCKKNEKIMWGGKETLAQDIYNSDDPNIENRRMEKVTRPDQLADIDIDFQSDERDNVKDYIKRRFGQYHTCSVGTFGRLKLKGAMTDFGREKGVDFSYLKIITKDIDDEQEYTFKDFMQYCLKSKELYDFAQKYPEIIHLVKHCMGQAKTASVHASAVIIVPEEDSNGKPMNIFNWLPVRSIDGKLVSEWEGKYTDRAGYLKEDILGLSQLDKFRRTITLIKRNTGKVVDLNYIPLADDKVYELFKQGLNEDVFQFGSWGLKKYSYIAKPDTVEDLTAMTSLYRPGPMDSNAHLTFAQIKSGKKKPEFDKGFEKVTANTFGLLVYQEQIMQSMVVAGLTLVESDLVRTMMKKFDHKSMEKFQEKFETGLWQKGVTLPDGSIYKYTKEDAAAVWKKMLAFSGYGFNKSHALAYSLISYQSQWLKVNYPLEFWTASMQYAKDDFIPARISEIRKLKQGIEIKPPSINFSDMIFECNKDTNSIYWSLSKIKNLGEATVSQLIEERKLNGLYGSYDDFVKRTTITKSKLNRRHITCLILAGAFDDVEGIRYPEERRELLMRHLRRTGSDIADKYNDPDKVKKRYFWIFEQRELIGYGDVDFKELLTNSRKPNIKKYISYYCSAEKLAKAKDYDIALVIGKVTDVRKRTSKKDSSNKYMVITMLHNNDEINITVWGDCVASYEEGFFPSLEGKLIGFLGKCRRDTYNGNNGIKVNSYEDTEILFF